MLTGLTETYGPASLQEMSDTRIGSVGAPLPSVEIKLVDVPEMGYTSKDKVEAHYLFFKTITYTNIPYSHTHAEKSGYAETQ